MVAQAAENRRVIVFSSRRRTFPGRRSVLQFVALLWSRGRRKTADVIVFPSRRRTFPGRRSVLEFG
jgi:hypothetical protein